MVKLKRPLSDAAARRVLLVQPIEATAVPAGSEVRTRITGAASDRVAPMLGTLDTRVLIGSVIENNEGSMMLEVPNGAMPNVVEGVVPLHARIPLAAGDMVSLERRRLDIGRTTILAGGIAAGVSLGVAPRFTPEAAARRKADSRPNRLR